MLVLTISLAQRRYSPGDQIMLTATLTNQGREPLLVNARLALNTPFAPEPFRELTLRIARDGQAELPFGARVNLGAPRPGDFRQLDAGARAEKEYNLSSYFELGEGSYTIQAVYQSRQEFEQGGARAWQGEVGSDAIRFEVGAGRAA